MDDLVRRVQLGLEDLTADQGDQDLQELKEPLVWLDLMDSREILDYLDRMVLQVYLVLPDQLVVKVTQVE